MSASGRGAVGGVVTGAACTGAGRGWSLGSVVSVLAWVGLGTAGGGVGVAAANSVAEALGATESAVDALGSIGTAG